MNTPYITAILAITSAVFSAGAIGENMSSSEYKAAENKIDAEYKSAITSCNFLAPNAKDICMAEAKRTEKSERTDLKARYRPINKVSYKLTVSSAENNCVVA
jgi:hypothetical protein